MILQQNGSYEVKEAILNWKNGRNGARLPPGSLGMSSPTGTSREEPRPATAESVPLTSANADTVGTVESLRRMYKFI